MNYKIIAAALLIQNISLAQVALDFNIMPLQKNYNPIPYRDSIPNALIKPNPIKIRVLSNSSETRVVQKPNFDSSVNPVNGYNANKYEITKLTTEKITLPPPTSFQAATPNTVAKRIYPSPPTVSIPNNIKLLPVQKPKIIYNVKTEAKVPAVKPLAMLPQLQLKTDQLNISQLIFISNDEYKMIEALMVYEFQKKLDSAFSLFADLQSSQQFKDQAQFYYAELAYLLGLNSEFKTKMLYLVKNSQEDVFKKQALTSLIQNAKALDVQDISLIETEIARQQMTSLSDAYLIKKAKHFINQGQLLKAQESLTSISLNSKSVVEAKILLSTVQYRLGDLNSAIKQLEMIQNKLANDRTEKLRNLTYLTLARLYFQKGQYKQSYANYLLIDKSSQFWLQSTTEQALTQIMAGDYIGAAGNMFSIHTDYFKKAYSPESYIIRAIGYLNLCQFGDSVSVVSELQKKYTHTYEQISSYENSHKNSNDYYLLFRELFNNNDQADVKGVAKSFIIELARHPSFMSIQKKINSLEEEVTQFNQIAINLTNKGSQIKQQILQTQSLIANLQNKKMTELQIDQLKRKVLVLEADLTITKTGYSKIEKMKQLASERISAEKNKLKLLAGEVLKNRYALAKNELAEVLEQKDVLAYEIYSGAGEHLRYQMAGGETNERAPAKALTPEEKKSYKWKFRGEVWEDEIGHYRSSLTNVCPKNVAHNQGEQ